MEQLNNNKEVVRNNVFGIAGSIGFHLILIVLLLLSYYKTPNPPFPDTDGGGGGGLGIEVNLGNSDNGMGDVANNMISFPEFKSNLQEIENPPDVFPKSTETINSDYVTSEHGEATSINQNQKKNPVETSEEAVNPNYLYHKKKPNSDGTTGKEGNQGDPNGDPNSKYYYKGSGTGSGTGTGSGIGSGTGSGIGSGNGSGIGTGNGSGISFKLNGRVSRALPKPDYSSNDQGTVVVKIWVNQKGEVTQVQAGERGTTTTDRNLWRQAEDAASKSKFSANPDAPEEQIGTITYKFIKLN